MRFSGSEDQTSSKKFKSATLSRLLASPKSRVRKSKRSTIAVVLGICALVQFTARSQAEPGGIDPSFNIGSGPNGAVYAIAARSDGKIIVGGAFTQFNGRAANHIVQLNSDGSTDLSFDIGVGADAPVTTIELQPDGKILLSGGFQKVSGATRNGVARLNSDGGLDPTFDPGQGTYSVFFRSLRPIWHFDLQPDGRIILTGAFYEYDGISRNGLARILSSGKLDPSFKFPANSPKAGFTDAAVVANGTIIVTGDFSSYKERPRNSVARLASDGSFDPAFDARIQESSENILAPPVVQTAVSQPDGKFLVGGRFIHIQDRAQPAIARFNTDGTFDSSFAPQFTGLSGTPTISQMTVEPTSRILLLGSFVNVDGIPRSGLARVEYDGTLDDTFRPQISNPSMMALQSNGDLIVLAGGTNIVRLFGGTPAPTSDLPVIIHQPVDRHVTEGQDVSFAVAVSSATPVHFQWQRNGADISGATNAGLFLPNVRVTDAAEYRVAVSNSSGPVASTAAKLTITPPVAVDLSFDSTMGPNDNAVRALDVQDDGKIIIGGAFTGVNGIARNQLARLEPDGSVDLSFDPEVPISGTDPNAVTVVVRQPDSKIIIGGARVPTPWSPSLPVFAGTYYVARFTPDGQLDPEFALSSEMLSNAIPSVRSVVLQADGKIIYEVTFNDFAGFHAKIVRLNSDGMVDLSFQPPNVATAIFSMALQPDGKLLVAEATPPLIRLNSDGSRDIPFDAASMNGPANSLTVQPNGKILIGGKFTSVAETPRNHIARLRSDGSLDRAFDPAAFLEPGASSGGVPVFAVQNDGRILIADTMGSGQTSSNYVARVNDDGKLDTTFSMARATAYSFPQIYALKLQPDGDILAAGAFTAINGIPRNGLARLHGTPSPPALRLVNPSRKSQSFTVTIPSTEPGKTIFFEYKNSMADPNWTTLSTTVADGSMQILSDASPMNGQRFYRVRVE